MHSFQKLLALQSIRIWHGNHTQLWWLITREDRKTSRISYPCIAWRIHKILISFFNESLDVIIVWQQVVATHLLWVSSPFSFHSISEIKPFFCLVRLKNWKQSKTFSALVQVYASGIPFWCTPEWEKRWCQALCPRPGFSRATGRPPLALSGEAPEQGCEEVSARADPFGEPRPSRSSAVSTPGTAQAAFTLLPEATEASDPYSAHVAPVVLCPARSTGPAPALPPGRRPAQPRARSDLLALLSAIQQALPASPIPAFVAQLPRQTFMWQQDGYIESD